MAGVGFELRKLFNQSGLLNNAKAYAFSSVTTVGPMMLCMFMIVAMQWLMNASNSSFLERELFLATVVYCFIFSVLLTGGLSMFLTRYISDMIYLKKYEHLMSSYYGSIAVCLPFGMLLSWLFLRGVTAGMGYKLAAYLFFAELIVIWLQAVYMSALKDYFRIVRNFFIGVVTSLLGAWLLLKFTTLDGATAVLSMMDVGFFLLLLLTNRHFEEMFPPKNSRIYFEFLTYLNKFPSLFFIGTFFYSGVYIHSFVYWFGIEGLTVANNYRISPFYDLPVFYAYLSVIPSLVTFVVSVETAFYEKYSAYYSNILNGGNLQDIIRAKKDMQRTLVTEIGYIMEVQLLFSLISLALGMKFLPLIGFTIEQLDTFNILVLGYYLFIIAFIVLLLMLYFDDRKGVVMISGLFVLTNALLSYLTLKLGYHGLGMFIASLITLILALTRLLYYGRNIDYYTFCKQPMTTIQRKRSIWKRLWGKSIKLFVILSCIIIVLTACKDNTDISEEIPKNTDTIEENVQLDKLIEDKRIYEKDNDTSIETLYVTVLDDLSIEGNDISWYDLNRDTNRNSTEEVNVIFQAGAADGSGPHVGEFAYGATEANARISLRGNTTRYASQKSYRIKLFDLTGLWMDQRIINLNKHPYDLTRITNKLSFDLFETLPNITSLRTRFVHLYVKDLSKSSDGNTSFVDYGLFTQIEQPNTLFLKSHWLDPYALFYKATNFEFFRYPDQLKLKSDADYDKAKFETVLEIKGSEDHSRLLQMLDALNDETIPFKEKFDKYFDRDNYLTWISSNILMDNMDTNSQNFYLYSPLNSNKWFFLPWDYDGAWGEYDFNSEDRSRSDWQYGISNYWGVTLHKRFFHDPDNVIALGDKIKELAKVFNPERINKLIAQYRSVVDPLVSQEPDVKYLPGTLEELEARYNSIAAKPLNTSISFFTDLEKPMPIFLQHIIQGNGDIHFNWSNSYDFQGDDLSYIWELAKDTLFTNVIAYENNLKGTSKTISKLDKGTYYWRIKIIDSKGNQQIPFDTFRDEQGDKNFGMLQLKVE